MSIQQDSQKLLQGSELNIVQPLVEVLAVTKIVSEPFLYQIGSPKHPSYTLNPDGGYHADGEYLTELAGRQCYESFHNPAGRSTNEYIGNIIAQQHFSVLEHTNVSFRLTGVSRSFTHELIRHRHLSFSQLSQRYVDSTTAPFVCPPLILSDPRLTSQWLRSLHVIQEQMLLISKTIDLYHPELPQKERREAARSLVPNAIETKIVCTGNLRCWRDIIEKRWSSHADAEIRQVFGTIAEDLKHIYPSTFADINYSE